MRSLNAYLDLTYEQLTGKLAIVTLELMHACDQIGFLKSEELTMKRDAFLAIDDVSVAAKDRATSMAAMDHTIELVKVEAEKAVLIEERNFLLLLIARAHG